MRGFDRRQVASGIAIVCVAGIAAVVLAQTHPALLADGPRVASRVGAAGRSGGDANPAASRKPLQYYTSGVRGDIFGEPPAAPAPLPIAAAAAPAAAAPDDPLADYEYSGTVTMDGRMLALVENVKTRTGQYLVPGDAVLGGTVAGVTPDAVALKLASGDRRIAKTDKYSLTPLDKNAPYLNPAPPQATGLTLQVETGAAASDALQAVPTGPQDWQAGDDQDGQQQAWRARWNQGGGPGGPMMAGMMGGMIRGAIRQRMFAQPSP